MMIVRTCSLRNFSLRLLMSDYRAIISDIKNNKIAPVYILTGTEPYYLDKISDALERYVVDEADKDFDETILYGADSSAEIVIEAAGRFPMMSPRRLVMLKEAQSMTKAKSQLDRFAQYVGRPNENTVLAIVFKDEKPAASSGFMKALKANKQAVVFDSPKVKEYQLGNVIKDFCSEEKFSIEDKAVELLASNVGASLTKLFSEIEKLRIVLKPGEKRITADIVHEHIGISKEFNNFELIAALSRRDYFNAINIVKQFESNPRSNPTIVTGATIFTYFQRLVLAAFSSDKSDKGLMEVLQLKTPYALREIRTGLSSYNAAQLVKAIHLIREFDTRSKGIESTQKEFPLLLELIISILTL